MLNDDVTYDSTNILPLQGKYIRDSYLFINSTNKLQYGEVIHIKTRAKIYLYYQCCYHNVIYKNECLNMSIIVFIVLPNEIKFLEGHTFKTTIDKMLFDTQRL